MVVNKSSSDKKSLSTLLLIISWFLVGLIVCIVGISNTFALTYTNVGVINDDTSMMIEVSYQTESGLPNLDVPINTVINTQFKTMILTVSNYEFLANTQYQLEIHLPNMQITNSNTYRVTGGSNNSCRISYENSIFQNEWPRWNFQCSNTTDTVSIFVYNTNGSNITNMGLFSWDQAYLRYTNEEIIDNSSNAIIDNNNQNTQNIIDNQNQNTQQQINSQRVCFSKVLKYSDKITDGYIDNNSGHITTANNWGVTDFLEITGLDILSPFDSISAYSCFYDENKNVLSCIRANNTTGKYNLPNGTKYARFSIRNNDVPEYYVSICKNGNQALNDSLEEQNKKLDDLNNSLTDDSSISLSSLNSTAGWLPAGPVDSILTLPLSMLNGLSNALNSSCSPLHIKIPFLNNKYIDIPCISTIFNQITGLNSFWSWVGVISSCLILYNYLLSLYKWVDSVLSLRLEFDEAMGSDTANWGRI